MAPRIVKPLRGAGNVYDYRSTGILSPSGGRITLLAAVEHIPVVPNVEGTEDFETLARVLRNQGLSLQAATDREGNVALFTPLNRLCWQARGLNQVSFGTEHMHMTISERWTRRQLRASAWLWQYAERQFGIPLQRGLLGSGVPGVAKVLKRGHVSHQAVSQAAGYNDRVDPGPLYDWEYVAKAARFFKVHGHFLGV